MLKDATPKEKFAMLRPWMPNIVEIIKRDLKNEHLRTDSAFVKKYFTSKDINKLTSAEMAHAYGEAIETGADNIAEFIINRWLIKNSEIYDYFALMLEKIVGEFTELQELEESQAITIMNGAVEQFGAPRTYQFAVMNSVVFPKKVFAQLSEHAEKTATQAQILAEERRVKELEIKDQHQFELAIARLQDKYEKKLAGLQKKYIEDISSLKKQIATLQRKLGAT